MGGIATVDLLDSRNVKFCKKLAEWFPRGFGDTASGRRLGGSTEPSAIEAEGSQSHGAGKAGGVLGCLLPSKLFETWAMPH